MHAAKTTARTMTNTNSVVLSVSMLMFFLYFLYPPSCLAVEAPRPQSPVVDFADDPATRLTVAHECRRPLTEPDQDIYLSAVPSCSNPGPNPQRDRYSAPPNAAK